MACSFFGEFRHGSRLGEPQVGIPVINLDARPTTPTLKASFLKKEYGDPNKESLVCVNLSFAPLPIKSQHDGFFGGFGGFVEAPGFPPRSFAASGTHTHESGLQPLKTVVWPIICPVS